MSIEERIKDMTPDQLRAEIVKIERVLQMMGKICHDQTTANQAAWIEWQHGRGADAAMGWIHNGLWGPGLIPDEDEPYAKEAQAWYDANCADPIPQCACGRPSNQLWMGRGACSDPCMKAARESRAGSAKAALLAGGAVNLLDQQHPGVVAAQVLDVVPSAALRTDETGAVVVGGQSDQSVGNVEVAEVAPEHAVGVPAGSDSGMTASLALPERYVPERAMLRVATGLREKASRSARPLERKTLIASAEALEKAVSAARLEVQP